jgi:hypothetical protein
MMSKQTAIILILVVFIGAIGALLWFYFTVNTTTQSNPSPFSDSNTYNPFEVKPLEDISSTSTAEEITPNQENITVFGKLSKMSEELISGFSVIKNNKTQKTNIHYILRSNGNIYEAYTDSPETKRLSGTTIPKVYESVWLPDGEKLIIRYLKSDLENIETFSVKINPATTTLNEFAGGIDGNYLPENVTALAINPVGDKIFYLKNNLTGSTGYVSKPDSTEKKSIFESPFTEWMVSWPKENIITLNTKASSNVPGYLYFLNSQTGVFSRALGNINGLTTKTNKEASEVLYSDSTRSVPRLYLYNVKSGESKLLPFSTLPEKCLWSNTDSKIVYCAVPKTFPSGDYPDIWYQGLISFNDDIWMVNTETMASTLIMDIEKEASKNIDAVELQLDFNDNYLFFINKTDLSLWNLKLK